MYRPLDHLPAFQDKTRFDCDNAESISRNTIVFELCGWRYEDDLTYIAQKLQEAAKL
jgi:hypothetical protein